MTYPPLLKLASAAEYRIHFENIYCRWAIATFDGIEVRFRKKHFNHCFFEASQRDGNKDLFSPIRAERMDWIKAGLQDPDADRYQGWDKTTRTHTRSRRVTVVMGSYVIVIAIVDTNRAEFVTAFVADSATTLDRIKKGPKWA